MPVRLLGDTGPLPDVKAGSRLHYAGFLIGGLCIGFVILSCTYIVGSRSASKIVQGIRSPVADIRGQLWVYHTKHRHAPAKLSEIIPPAGGANSVSFRTQQGIRCDARYTGRVGSGVPVLQVRCGDPLLADIELSADGRVLRNRWSKPLWFRVMLQRRADPTLPMLR